MGSGSIMHFAQKPRPVIRGRKKKPKERNRLNVIQTFPVCDFIDKLAAFSSRPERYERL